MDRLDGCRLLEITSEALDPGKHSFDRKFAQGAQAFAFDLTGDVPEQLDIFPRRLAVGNPVGQVLHPISAFAARGALTA